MLPQNCNVSIDIEEKHAKYCFNLDKIMFYVVLMDLSFFLGDSGNYNKIIKQITNLGKKYGLIDENCAELYQCIEGVCLIIDDAVKRIYDINQ